MLLSCGSRRLLAQTHEHLPAQSSRLEAGALTLGLPLTRATMSAIAIVSGGVALFNVMMLAEDLYGHKDGSYGAHNPFYYEALLSASISALVATYPTYLPAPPANVQAIMDKALSRPGVYYNRATGQLKLSSSIR